MMWVRSLRREFSDNRERVKKQGAWGKDIVGFSCWALGFLDRDGRRVGCLLHPALHSGRDLRDVTGYGEKCRREECLAAMVFSDLEPRCQDFYLGLADGLNSFLYSSPRGNPLFHVLLWGRRVLARFFSRAESQGMSVTEYFWTYPLVMNPRISPRAWRFPLLLILDRFSETPRDALLRRSDFPESVHRLIHELRCQVSTQGERIDEGQYVHRLGIDRAASDFLRQGLGIFKTSGDRAAGILTEFARRLTRLGEEVFL